MANRLPCLSSVCYCDGQFLLVVKEDDKRSTPAAIVDEAEPSLATTPPFARHYYDSLSLGHDADFVGSADAHSGWKQI